MMGYDGRSLLLNDEEEWVNIPFVVREFMRQLNDEVHASRSVIEAMRQEQKEVNSLLRRVMQKQADLEIDNTRTALALSRSSPTAPDATQRRQSEQIHYLRKKQERLEERTQLLESSVEEVRRGQTTRTDDQTENSSSAELKGIQLKLDDLSSRVESHLSSASDVLSTTQNLVTSGIAAAVCDADKRAEERLEGVMTRVVAVEKAAEAQREALEAQQHNSKKLRGICDELLNAAERDRKGERERHSACVKMVEKLEALCAAQKSSIERDIARVEENTTAELSTVRSELTSAYVDLRKTLESSQRDVETQCADAMEALTAVKAQQKILAQQLGEIEADSTAARALKISKELAQRVDVLDADAEKRAATYLTKRDGERLLRESQGAVDSWRSSVEETKASLQQQISQLALAVKTARAEHGEDNDWLHNEVGRLGTVISYATQQREKQDRQVSALCDIVHNLSVAVEAVQASLSKKSARESTADRAPPTASAPVEAATSTVTASADAAVPAAWQEWRQHVSETVEARLSALPAIQQRSERLSQQLNELSAKVDGGAKYAQSIASQHMEQMRQSIRDEVSQQLQNISSLRDLTPALVEVETVKRRLAGLELEVQSSAARAERSQADAQSGAIDSGSAASTVLRRMALVEDSVDGFKRRLLELGEHMMGMEQQYNSVDRAMHRLETQLEDQERVVAKLGTDLTSALESILRTEQSLSQHQRAVASQLIEMRTAVDKVRKDAIDSTVARVESTATVAERNVDRLRADLSALMASVEVLPNEIAADVGRQLRTMQSELEAVRHDCAAMVDAHMEETARSAQQATEEIALSRNRADTTRDELRQQLIDGEARLHAVVVRLGAVESLAAEHELALSSSATSAAAAAETAAAKAAASSSNDRDAEILGCVKDLKICFRRLDEQQQQISALSGRVDATPRAVEETAQREWQQRVDALRQEVAAWVSRDLAVQQGGWREEVQRCVEAALPTAETKRAPELQPELTATQLQQLAEHVRVDVEGRFQQLLAEQHRAASDTARQVEDLQVSHAELRREMRDTFAAQREQHETSAQELRDALDDVRDAAAAAATQSAPLTSARGPPAVQEDDRWRSAALQWKDDVLHSVHAEFYTKSLLEERLENIWSSMVSLLARKEDMAVVNEKLSGLHRLMQEELQIEMEKLEDQLAGQLAEKVSLANLQDVLEEQFVDDRR